MFEDFRNRQQYIRANNEMNREVDSNKFIQGNKQKMELDRKLEEISINSGHSFSGNIVRQNVLNSSASRASTLNTSIAYDDSVKFDNNTMANLSLKNSINRGRDSVQSMNFPNRNNNTNNFNFNKFNRNI